MLLFIIIHTLLLGTLGSQKCEKYIADLIYNRFATLKNTTILYSGLAINNVGQMQECQRGNFSYFLIYLPNKPPKLTSFTGLCIPSDCDREDVQEQVSYYTNAQTFDFITSELDTFACVGLVVFFVYGGIVAAVMIVNSFKDEEVHPTNKTNKTQSIEDQTKMEINISVNDKQPLIEQANRVSSKEKGVVLRLFGGYNHYCKIFHVSPKKNILSGLKCMAIFIIIVATEFSFRQNISQNHEKAATLLSTGAGYLITNVDFAYSTLLFIVGLTAAYSLYKVDNLTDIFKSILSKFMRIWPVLVIFILIAYGISEYIISDPLLKIWEQKNTIDCPATFWRKWFLINPLILDGTVCLPWTWLVETELLLFIFAPVFMVVSRSSKLIGYASLLIAITISIVFSAFFLDYKKVEFTPSLIFNNGREFTYEFQMNPLVRSSNFAIGLLFGVFFINGLEKIENEGTRTNEYKFAKMLKRSKGLQYFFQIFGFSLMSVAFWAIIPISEDNPSQRMLNFFLVGAPTIFLTGLGMLITPSVLSAESPLTTLINKILAGSFWAPLDKMAFSIYLATPLVIGVTTYSLQTSLYYSYENIFVLLLGDLVLIMLVGLILTACLEMPFVEAHKELDYYIFGQSSKESVVIIED